MQHVEGVGLMPMTRADFFGTGISITNPSSQVQAVEELLLAGKAAYVTYSNVHVVVTAVKDTALREAVNHADMASPDGMPLVWVAKLKGYTGVARCPGPDMMGRLMASGLRKGYSHYFYGGTPEELERLRESLVSRYPGIRIAGMWAPPFRPLTDKEQQEVMETINKAGPDFIWVGLGAPKQEIWMHQNVKKLNRGIMFGVGAAFDFFAGTKKRAPLWMQKAGLEWFFRLCSEPGRLFRRYFCTNSLFVGYLIRDLFRKRAPDKDKSTLTADAADNGKIGRDCVKKGVPL